MVKTTLLLAVCLSLAVAMSACGSRSDPSPAPSGGAAASPAAGGAVDAQAVYKRNCISCHGGNLEGRLGPNTNLQTVGARRSRGEIAARINNGGGGMPAFGGRLNDTEINALADWLAAKK